MHICLKSLYKLFQQNKSLKIEHDRIKDQGIKDKVVKVIPTLKVKTRNTNVLS